MTKEKLNIETVNEKTSITYSEDFSAVKKMCCKDRSKATIKFNEKVVKICSMAGRELWAPIELMLPSELRTVEMDAFAGSTGIKDISFNDKLLSIGADAFSGTSVKVLNIPLNVSEIEKEAFSECRDLVEVVSFGSVNAIYESMFSNCINLKNVNIPNGVTYIDDFAFFNCQGLEEITIPKNVAYISKSAFKECDNLKNIYVSQKTFDLNPDFVKEYGEKVKVKTKVATQVFDMNTKELENVI